MNTIVTRICIRNKITKIASCKRSQAWVETVIYVLIGLIIIGIVLAVATPAVEKYKDRILIEQSLSALGKLDEKILEIQTAPYNKRIIEFKLQKGALTFNGVEDKISLVINSELEYSEPGAVVSQGNLKILTEERAGKYLVTLSTDYSAKSINLTFNSKDAEKTLNQASVPYSIEIENLGVSGGMINIDVRAA